METLTKTESDLKKVEKYLETSSKHLFLTEKGKFFKIFPIKLKDKMYCVRLEFDGTDSNNNVWIFDIERYVKFCKNPKHALSKYLFPLHYDKKKSIPNFKLMREKVSEIKKMIEENFNGSNEKNIGSEISKKLIGLTVKKKEE